MSFLPFNNSTSNSIFTISFSISSLSNYFSMLLNDIFRTERSHRINYECIARVFQAFIYTLIDNGDIKVKNTVREYFSSSGVPFFFIKLANILPANKRLEKNSFFIILVFQKDLLIEVESYVQSELFKTDLAEFFSILTSCRISLVKLNLKSSFKQLSLVICNNNLFSATHDWSQTSFDLLFHVYKITLGSADSYFAHYPFPYISKLDALCSLDITVNARIVTHILFSESGDNPNSLRRDHQSSQRNSANTESSGSYDRRHVNPVHSTSNKVVPRSKNNNNVPLNTGITNFLSLIKGFNTIAKNHRESFFVYYDRVLRSWRCVSNTNGLMLA